MVGGFVDYLPTLARMAVIESCSTPCSHGSVYMTASNYTGFGCLSSRQISRGESVGVFHGKTISLAEAMQHTSNNTACILEFESWRGRMTYLKIFTLCPLSRINSARGLHPPVAANVHFVCDGQTVEVFALRDIAPGQELLADYDWHDPLLRPTVTKCFDKPSVAALSLFALARSGV